MSDNVVVAAVMYMVINNNTLIYGFKRNLHMQSSKEELKKTLLDMLEQDKEFRHAIAGAIGYKEILDRIAKVEEEIKSLREETKALREEANNLRKDMNDLRRDMLEGFKRHDEEFAKMRQDMLEGFRRHDEELKRHWESIEKLRQDMQEGFRRHDEEFARVWKSIEAMRKDMQEGFKRMDKRLSYIESFMDNISVSIEDEARDMVAYLLKQKGITLNITDLTLPDLEIDIYAVDTDYCIVGEAKTRAVRKAILQVEKDIARLCKKYPSYTRGKVIKVVYAIRAMPDAVEEARSRGIWLVTARGELTELKI
ncbi:MAG: hypothetical protein QXE62_07805 [Candidatus Nitrosocaldaceae archaeon]